MTREGAVLVSSAHAAALRGWRRGQQQGVMERAGGRRRSSDIGDAPSVGRGTPACPGGTPSCPVSRMDANLEQEARRTSRRGSRRDSSEGGRLSGYFDCKERGSSEEDDFHSGEEYSYDQSEMSLEEEELLIQLRTQILDVDLKKQENEETMEAEERNHKMDAKVLKEGLKELEARRNAVQKEIAVQKEMGLESHRNRKLLSFATLAFRLLKIERTQAAADPMAKAVRERNVRLLRLKERVSKEVIEVEEEFASHQAELEKLRRSDASHQAELEKLRHGGNTDLGVSVKEGLADLLAGSLRQDEAAVSSLEVRVLRSQVAGMQNQLEARSESAASSASSRCPLPAASATTSAGTSPRCNSEASASASSASTPRAPAVLDAPPSAVVMGGNGLPPARPSISKGGGKGAVAQSGPDLSQVVKGTGKGGTAPSTAGKGKGQTPPLAPSGKGTPPSGKGPPPPAGKGGPPPPGKGPPPPAGKGGPPLPGKGPPPSGKAKSIGTPLKSNGLVNLTWKAVAEKSSEAEDKIRSLIVELDPKVANDEQKLIASSDTVFAEVVESSIPAFSDAQLHEFFRVVPPAAMRSGSAGAGSAGGSAATQTASGSRVKLECLIDDKAAQRISILLQKAKMKAGGDVPSADVVAGLRRAILSCKAAPDVLDAMVEIVINDAETCQKVAAFVEARGVRALSLCGPEPEHRLLHAVNEIPRVADRLRCLIFEAQWPEAHRKCTQDLEVLHSGMKVLTSKLEPVMKKLFLTVLHLGNSLNKDSRAAIAQRGFTLATLPKLLQLKSSSKPSATLLHIALALLSESEVETLIKDLNVLSAAKDKKSSGVHQRCFELLSMLQTVSSLSKSIPKLMRTRTPAAAPHSAAPLSCTASGHFAALVPRSSRDLPPPPLPQDARHRRRSPGPQMRQAVSMFPAPPGQPVEPVEELHPDDRFHARIELFLHGSRSKARYIVMLLRDIFETYWELAHFFEDPWAVYPPPQKKDDLSEDIFVFFHSFLSEVATASKEVIQFGLREEIAVARAKASGIETPTDAGSSATAGSSASSSASVPQAGAKTLSTRSPSLGSQAGTKTFPTRAPSLGSQAARTMSTRAPSPGPQVGAMSRSNSMTRSNSDATALDVTMLRRLTVRNSVDVSMTRTRSCTSTSGNASSSIGDLKTSNSLRVEDEDDGHQSDVSDWQDSPRKEASPPRDKVKPKPLFATPVAVAAVPATLQEAKPQAEPVSLGGPPQRSVRRQASASPSPAGRSAGLAASTFRTIPTAFCSGTASTAAVMANQVSSSQGTAIPSVVAAVVPPGQSNATAALGPPPAKRASCVPSAAPIGQADATAALGPPPARRALSRDGRRSLLPSPSGSPSRGSARKNFYSSKKMAESPPMASPIRSRAPTTCAHQPSPCFNHSSPSHSPAPAMSLTPPPRQPQARPNNGTQGRPGRKSLSMAADRIQKEKLKELLGSSDSGQDDDSHGDARKMWHQWPERRCRSDSSDSRSPSPAPPVHTTSSPAAPGETSPSSPWVQMGLQAAARVQRRTLPVCGSEVADSALRVQRRSLQVCGSMGAGGCDRHSMGGTLLGELQAEVLRRRSLSTVRSPRTPRRSQFNAGGGHELTPVAEPGETPHSDGLEAAGLRGSASSCRSRGSPRATVDHSADHSIFSLTRD